MNPNHAPETTGEETATSHSRFKNAKRTAAILLATATAAVGGGGVAGCGPEKTGERHDSDAPAAAKVQTAEQPPSAETPAPAQAAPAETAPTQTAPETTATPGPEDNTANQGYTGAGEAYGPGKGEYNTVSEQDYDSIPIGMSGSEVSDKLGKPQSIMDGADYVKAFPNADPSMKIYFYLRDGFQSESPQEQQQDGAYVYLAFRDGALVSKADNPAGLQAMIDQIKQ